MLDKKRRVFSVNRFVTTLADGFCESCQDELVEGDILDFGAISEIAVECFRNANDKFPTEVICRHGFQAVIASFRFASALA